MGYDSKVKITKSQLRKTIREELIKEYNSPFAVESCHIKFKDSDLTGHVYRSLFDTARQYRESIEVYGSKKSVEWPLIEHEELVVHTAKKPEPEIPEKTTCPEALANIGCPVGTAISTPKCLRISSLLLIIIF